MCTLSLNDSSRFQELTFLKDIFLTHAGSSHGLCLDDLDVKALLREDDDNDGANDDNDDEDSTEMVNDFPYISMHLVLFIWDTVKFL